MKRFAYHIKLLDDLVISRRAATLGGHQSLDYLPGQTLLGACAARLYQQLAPGQAFTVFHSGRVRFGNALPLGASGPAWPIPMCWHQRKAQPATDDQGRLCADRLFNFQHQSGFDDGGQPQQLRRGYVDGDGRLYSPHQQMRLRMKTAIDPASGRAAEAQLFGYQSIARGSCFGGWLEADDDVDEPLFTQLTESLRGELLLGRSRSAEYGRARLSAAAFEPPPAPPGGRVLTLWLLSDLAPQDPWGQPSLDPSPAHIGLPGGQVDWRHSFLRHRDYQPWNGKRGAPDLQRQVIQQGSVLVLTLDEAIDDAVLDRCRRGLGLHRESGLGRVLVNHPLLASPQPVFALSDEQTAATPATTPARPDHPLIAYLEQHTGIDAEREAVERQARELSRQFIHCQRQSARWRGLPVDQPFGPSRSQWGRVLETARNAPASQLSTLLFDGDDAVVKESAEGWGESFFDGRAMTSLAAWLRQALKPHVDEPTLPRLVQRLAHLSRDQEWNHHGAAS